MPLKNFPFCIVFREKKVLKGSCMKEAKSKLTNEVREVDAGNGDSNDLNMMNTYQAKRILMDILSRIPEPS